MAKAWLEPGKILYDGELEMFLNFIIIQNILSNINFFFLAKWQKTKIVKSKELTIQINLKLI